MPSHSPDDRTRDDLPDGRNGHVVGENDDNVLESFGKAVIAPLEGAAEAAPPLDVPDTTARVTGATPSRQNRAAL